MNEKELINAEALFHFEQLNISDLLINMAARGATRTELLDVMTYSQRVLDVERIITELRKSRVESNIKEMERKYAISIDNIENDEDDE